MRCRKVRRLLLEEGKPALSSRAQQHMALCPACQAAAAGWQRIEQGFQALAAEPSVEPSWGFAASVTRRLESVAADAARVEEALVAAVGRKFVYASLVLAFLLSLALLLPSSSPWKEPTSSEVYLAEPEAVAARTYPAFPGVAPENAVDFVPANGSEPAGRK